MPPSSSQTAELNIRATLHRTSITRPCFSHTGFHQVFTSSLLQFVVLFASDWKPIHPGLPQNIFLVATVCFPAVGMLLAQDATAANMQTSEMCHCKSSVCYTSLPEKGYRSTLSHFQVNLYADRHNFIYITYIREPYQPSSFTASLLSLSSFSVVCAYTMMDAQIKSVFCFYAWISISLKGDHRPHHRPPSTNCI